MRALLAAGLVLLLLPAVALAQSAPAATPPGQTATPPAATQSPAAARRGGDITRDDYIERAKERAASRFDEMDTDHDGVLTADERRAWRDSHGRRRRAAPSE